MKLECTADPRAWAEVCDVWTRKMLREFGEIVARPLPVYPAAPKDEAEAEERQAEIQAASQQQKADLDASYRRMVKSAHLCDADGNEYDLDGILAIENFDNVDAAVANWWGGLPWLAHAERQKLGEARRVN